MEREEDWIPFLPLLNDILQSKYFPETSNNKRLSKQQKWSHLFPFLQFLICEYVIVHQGHQPLTIVLDNAQYLDAYSLRLAYKISKKTSAMPLILIIATRPPLTPSPEYQMIYTSLSTKVLRLGPLSDDESYALFGKRIGAFKISGMLSFSALLCFCCCYLYIYSTLFVFFSSCY